MLAQVVPKKVLQNAITWNTSAFLSASIAGHAIGGFLIAGIGNTGTMIVVVLLVFISFIVLTSLKRKPSLNERGEKKTWDSVKEGLSFVFKTRELLAAVSLDLFAVLFGGAVALIPVYARDILKVGARGFGFLNGASDIGSVFIVIILTLISDKKKTRQKTSICSCRFRYLYYRIRHVKIILDFLRRFITQWYHGRHQCGHQRYYHAIKNS